MGKKSDYALLQEANDALARMDCQYFACEGPFKRSRAMRTCFRCRTLRQIWLKHPELKDEVAEGELTR